jgi:hypothetical protein
MATFRLETLHNPAGDPRITEQQKTSERGDERKLPNDGFGISTQTNCPELSWLLPPAKLTYFSLSLKYLKIPMLIDFRG